MIKRRAAAEYRAAEELELVGLPHVPNAEEDVLGAGVAELAEAIDDLLAASRAAAAVAARR